MDKSNNLNEKGNATHTKKTWQTPEFYLLSTANVDGGVTVTRTVEVRTGNHKVKTSGGNVLFFGTPVYNSCVS